MLNETMDICPICEKKCHPFLSNGIAVEVPHMKEGKICERVHYHAHCIQNLTKEKKSKE